MSVEAVNILQLVIGAIVAIGVIVGGYWGLARLVINQLDDRFKAQADARIEGRKQYEERFGRLETDHHKLERAHMQLLADLPREYVRREDHIRFETVINAKLDALNARIELLTERTPPRG